MLGWNEGKTSILKHEIVRISQFVQSQKGGQNPKLSEFIIDNMYNKSSLDNIFILLCSFQEETSTCKSREVAHEDSACTGICNPRRGGGRGRGAKGR